MRYRHILMSLIPAVLLLSLLSYGSSATVTHSRQEKNNPASELSAVAVPDIEISVGQIIAQGLDQPIQLTHAGDGSGRLFIVEQPGYIQIIQNGEILSTPFLNVSTHIITTSWEQGLLGLAFHPDYETNGLFYIDYTRAEDGATVVARYRVSENHPNRADPTTAKTVLTVTQPHEWHNGGQLAFGPDGYLYISLGDGGEWGDPLETAQDPTELLGSILRIDVDGGAPYAIPPHNPYIGTQGRDEIWAIGLRNPWRFSFDRDTGDIYIGDVGQNAWEEIDFYPAWDADPGSPNFGWDCLEGSHEYEWTSSCENANFNNPIAEYNHTIGRSVTGGFVYRGKLYPTLEGRYFYADFVTGKIWSTVRTEEGFTLPSIELDTELRISAFGEDEAGELYVVDRKGSIRLLADVTGPTLLPTFSTSKKTVSSPHANPGEKITYTLTLINRGQTAAQAVTVTDEIPMGLRYIPGSLTATEGIFEAINPTLLLWRGPVNGLSTVTVTYQVSVTGDVTGSLVNYGRLTGPSLESQELTVDLFVPRSILTTTLNDLLLPGTQPGELEAPIPSSLNCDTCHSEPIYDAWRGTMMSQSARDPLMRAALATANADAGFDPEAVAGDYCLRCHAPSGWLADRSHPVDGSTLNHQDIANGVACAVCHRMADPRARTGIDARVVQSLTHKVPNTYTGSATIVIDPTDERRGPFPTSKLPEDFLENYHTANQTDLLGQAADPITRSRLCGSCHNVDNPLLSWDPNRGEYWPNTQDAPPDVARSDLFPIETTFTEWLYSDYPAGVQAPQFAGAKPDDTVAACQDCHLQRQVGTAADPQFDPVPRDCQTTGCLPQHQMVGGNAWIPNLLQDPDWRLNATHDADHLQASARAATSMLRRAATLSATLHTSGTRQLITVRVTNHSGHKLPTGYPEGRQMWLHVKAYNAADDLVYESGRYDTLNQRLIRDEDIQVYEAKQGLTPDFAAFLNRPPGATFHFILNNTVIKDNRIPPRGYHAQTWDQPGLRPVGATYADGQYWHDAQYLLPEGSDAMRVSAILYYQTASREYVDFLKAHGGVDGEALYTLWQRTPSPPILMAADLGYEIWFPIITKSWSPR